MPTNKNVLFLIQVVMFGVLLIGAFAAMFGIRDDLRKVWYKVTDKPLSAYAQAVSAEDEFWAKEIMKGGYILHFRHAERDKWIDVQMYDALESDVHDNGDNGSRFAENDYFSQAVCLNQRGMIQAKAMGEHIQRISLPIGPVISSVSCRARQTAELAFNGYQSMERLLVHEGPYNERNSSRIEVLKAFYMDIPIENGKNTIVSAHNGVIRSDIFINRPKNKLFLEEGGFYVISRDETGLKLEYEFNNFLHFIRVFYER